MRGKGKGDKTHHKSVVWNHLARLANLDILSADVLAYRHALVVEPDRLAQSRVDAGKLGLPGLHGETRNDLGDGLIRGPAVLCEGAIDLGLYPRVPVGLVGEMGEDPGGAEGAVDQAGEEGAHDELRAACQ